MCNFTSLATLAEIEQRSTNSLNFTNEFPFVSNFGTAGIELREDSALFPKSVPLS